MEKWDEAVQGMQYGHSKMQPANHYHILIHVCMVQSEIVFNL